MKTAISLPTDWPVMRPRTLGARLARRIGVRLRRLLPKAAYQTVRSGYYGARILVRRNPGRGRVMPDYLVIGVIKGGTTSLCAALNEHPFVSPASKKEIHFFDYDFYRGIDWYRSNFPLERQRADFATRNGRPFLTGEASPSYFSHPWAPERIARHLPDAKLIVAMRNPIDRAYSHFHMSFGRGEEPIASFEDAIAHEEERLTPETKRLLAKPRYNSVPLACWSYLLRGRYAEHLERWLQFFPREQFLFVKSEDLTAEPNRTLSAVHEFLGLAPRRLDEYPHFFRGSYEPMAADTRARLAEYFRPHNERLYELVGFDFGWDR